MSGTGPRDRSAYLIAWTQQTRWNDDDAYGHVNNATYLEYVDSAVNGWLLRVCDTHPRTLDALGVVAHTSCDFHAEVSFPEVVQVGLARERLGRTSVTYRVGVFGSAEPLAAATARFVHVYVDRLTRRPVPVPDVVAAAVADLPGLGGDTAG